MKTFKQFILENEFASSQVSYIKNLPTVSNAQVSLWKHQDGYICVSIDYDGKNAKIYNCDEFGEKRKLIVELPISEDQYLSDILEDAGFITD